jgi:hypothetical protein
MVVVRMKRCKCWRRARLIDLSEQNYVMGERCPLFLESHRVKGMELISFGHEVRWAYPRLALGQVFCRKYCTPVITRARHILLMSLSSPPHLIAKVPSLFDSLGPATGPDIYLMSS